MLSVGSNSNASKDGYMGDGVYVDDAKIVEVVNVTNDSERNRFGQNLAIQVTMELAKNEWKKIVTISGNYKRDNLGAITDWGGLFKLKDFLNATTEESDADFTMDTTTMEGFPKEVENQVPSDEMLKACVGKKVLCLTYTKKGGGYATWDGIGQPGRTKESFADYFKSNHAKSQYPKNYDPAGSSSKSSSPSPAPAPNVAEAMKTANTVKSL